MVILLSHLQWLHQNNILCIEPYVYNSPEILLEQYFNIFSILQMKSKTNVPFFSVGAFHIDLFSCQLVELVDAYHLLNVAVFFMLFFFSEVFVHLFLPQVTGE